MALPYELLIGLRYTRAKRRNHFISFISIDFHGSALALGVAALIVVLSVMNGFQKELRTRILGVASHIQISGINGELSDWPSIAAQAMQHPEVQGGGTFCSVAGHVYRRWQRQGLAGARHPEPDDGRPRCRFSQATIKSGSLDDLRPGEFGVVLGADLARSLRVFTGDKVTLIAPQGTVTPAGVVPRLKSFKVVGIFEVGMYEYDSGLALIHLQDAQKLYQMEDRVTGVRLKVDDLFQGTTHCARTGRYGQCRCLHQRLDQEPRQFLPGCADREKHDVHHSVADRCGGSIQSGVHAGHGGD
jgi:lipoprotein-releasing system permease protein